jgi:Zn-dependent protease with chaperone function
MADLHLCLWPLAYAYAAAAAGLAAALMARSWAQRAGRVPCAAEAAWCAFLPPIAVLVLPAAATLQPHAMGPLIATHALWHQWARALHAAPIAHGVLHVTNLLLLIFTMLCAARTLHGLGRARAFGAALRASGQLERSGTEAIPLYRLPSRVPTAFTLGILRPAVYASSGLLAQLSTRDCEAMLAHEAAHVRRRDGLTGALLAAFYNLFPLPGSGLLRAEWQRAAERACDADAARRLDSRTDVAAALVRVAGIVWQSQGPVPGAVRFAASGDDIEARVQALLAPLSVSQGRPDAPALSAWLILLSLGMIGAAHFWVHHAVELFVRH